MAARCPGCGHNFNGDSVPGRGGYCQWCVQEQDNPSHCYVCGKVATCSGHNGYLCDSTFCSQEDDRKSEEKFAKENGYD